MSAARLAVVSMLTASLAMPTLSEACTRAVYFGKEGQTVTGRTMDWFVIDMDTNMWMYPRGLERTSNTKTPVQLEEQVRQRRRPRSTKVSPPTA